MEKRPQARPQYSRCFCPADPRTVVLDHVDDNEMWHAVVRDIPLIPMLQDTADVPRTSSSKVLGKYRTEVYNSSSRAMTVVFEWAGNTLFLGGQQAANNEDSLRANFVNARLCMKGR